MAVIGRAIGSLVVMWTVCSRLRVGMVGLVDSTPPYLEVNAGVLPGPLPYGRGTLWACKCAAGVITSYHLHHRHLQPSYAAEVDACDAEGLIGSVALG